MRGRSRPAPSGRQRNMPRKAVPDHIPNPTPGEILLHEFLEPMELSQNGLARAIGVPPRRINEIVLGKRAITADTDLRLARYFGLSDGFWLGIQASRARRRPKRTMTLRSCNSVILQSI